MIILHDTHITNLSHLVARIQFTGDDYPVVQFAETFILQQYFQTATTIDIIAQHRTAVSIENFLIHCYLS